MGAFPSFLRERGVANSFYFTGLKLRDLEAFRASCPGFAHTVDDLPLAFHFATRAKRIELLRRIKGEGAFALNLDFRIVGFRLAELCSEAGLELRVWTVDAADEMRHAIALDACSITTNRVSELRRMLA